MPSSIASSAIFIPKLAARRTDMPVVPSGARHSTMNINSIHGGQAETPRVSRALRAGFLPHGDRPPPAHRREHGRRQRRGARRCWNSSSRSAPGFAYEHSRHFRGPAHHGRSQRPGGAQHRRRDSPRDGPRARSSSVRRAPTIRSTSIASASCGTASPTVREFSTWRISRTSTCVIDDMVNSAKVMALAARVAAASAAHDSTWQRR